MPASPSPAELKQLGLLLNTGRYTELESRANLLLGLYPSSGHVWRLLGLSLQMQGKNALTAFQKTVELMPADAGAYYNMGVVLSDRGMLQDAIANYRSAVKIKPDFAEAHNNLGYLLQALGQPDAALTSCRRALQIKPNFAEAHNNMGNALQDLGQIDVAVVSYRRALELNPDFALAHNNLGYVLQALGELGEALASYHRALEIKPDFAGAHTNLGIVLHKLGQLDKAVASHQRALEIKPDYAEAHNNLGFVLQDIGQSEDAIACYQRALVIKPDYAEAHNNLGYILQTLGQPEASMSACRRALEIRPDYAEAHINMGNALQDLGDIDASEVSYRRALEIKPNLALANSNLLFCLSHSKAFDAQTLFAEKCRFGEQFEVRLRANWPPHNNSRDPERRLQIGFVSGDLRHHAVANFIEPVLAHLAKYPQLSLHAYYNHTIEDAATQRLRGYLAHWHSIAGLPDDALAQQIREDGIDILIDLSGHTCKNRLLTFARKPVPIQASWIGYPGTTGLTAMDYYLADRCFLPPGQYDDQFTEKIIHLPAIAPFLPSPAAPAVNALPALSNGYLTLGSFNRQSKISRSVIALWSQLLRALTDSKMLLGGLPEEGKYGTLIAWFAEEGIAPERLDFHVRSDMQHYLALHHRVDLCLDTFPYTGGTTTLHALWMGVPTLTLAGRTPAGRQGAAILGHAGLDAFVADDAADFVRKGLSWAGDFASLSTVRTGLRERFAQSAMGQPALVAAGLERALRIMWQRWCEGLPPAAIDVSDNQMTRKTGPLESMTSGNLGNQGR